METNRVAEPEWLSRGPGDNGSSARSPPAAHRCTSKRRANELQLHQKRSSVGFRLGTGGLRLRVLRRLAASPRPTHPRLPRSHASRPPMLPRGPGAPLAFLPAKHTVWGYPASTHHSHVPQGVHQLTQRHAAIQTTEPAAARRRAPSCWRAVWGYKL